ncbi:fructose-bisphosphate aldolase-lysine N-methyltransferase, chloroplastic [Mercurialis annua]|uniref:fructose-bisphosphate aldolase-lysine N-methyltransferase, chloroplastic n=1 Tax=Mercurialis annua TaxID=3986 RepID=UPI002160EA1E|nr:fructose-bisphosphate aldolase-lysine N-methyltransferase, chloroplastic [Mercurialis annua]
MSTHYYTLSSSTFLFSSKPISPLTKIQSLHLKKSFFITSSSSLPSSTATTSPPSLQTFWQWLSDQGVATGKAPAKPGLVKEGLGLIAHRDIARNDVVLEIPKKLWINPDAVAASDIGSVCSGLKPWISVALFLIKEKGKKEGSKWWPYLDILPHSTNSTIYWSEEELAELQGTQLLRTTWNVKEYLQREFVKVQEEILIPHKKLFPSPITLDDFFWAFGMLKSRAFSRLRGQNLVLIPLADLINHSPDITTEDYAYEIKGGGLFSRDLLFSLRSPISVKAGEQVLIQYDVNKSNAELALDYGFIETKPGRNTYTLTLQISESDPFFGDKLDIAETNGLGETADFDIVLGSPLPPTLLPYLRLVALGGTDAFLLESIFRNTIWGHLELPVTRANEELICRVVRDACKAALSGYHTTIEEDEKLGRTDLNPKLEVAVGIRAGEKKVLLQIDEAFKQRESEMDEFEYYQERRLRDLGLMGEQGEIIFWEAK